MSYGSSSDKDDDRCGRHHDPSKHRLVSPQPDARRDRRPATSSSRGGSLGPPSHSPSGCCSPPSSGSLHRWARLCSRVRAFGSKSSCVFIFADALTGGVALILFLLARLLERARRSRRKCGSSCDGIVVRLDVMLALRKKRSKELAAKIGLTEANLSLLKSGKVRASAFRRWRRSASSSTASPATSSIMSPEPRPSGN